MTSETPQATLPTADETLRNTTQSLRGIIVQRIAEAVRNGRRGIWLNNLTPPAALMEDLVSKGYTICQVTANRRYLGYNLTPGDFIIEW